jgi:sugar phosphate isomerase/epimerase
MIELCASSRIYAGYSLETALAEIARVGFRAVDLWAVPRVCVHVDPLQDDAERIRRLLDSFGLRPAALSLYGSDVTRALAGIDFAAALGAEVVVTGAGVRSLDEAIEYLKPLARRAEARQIVVAPENHLNSPLESLAEMTGLFDALDGRCGSSLGITYAPPHSFACGEDPDKVILALGKRVALFYPWDVPRGYRKGSREVFWSNPDDQLPGQGSLDFTRMFASLRDVGYSGVASVVWQGSRDWELPRITTALRAASDFLVRHIG